MTSQSHKKRRTTRLRNPLIRMGISLGAVLLVGIASAQPPTLPIPAIPTPPAPVAPIANPPRPQLVPADAPPVLGGTGLPNLGQPIPVAPLAQPLPAKTMTFTKPAGQESPRTAPGLPVTNPAPKTAPAVLAPLPNPRPTPTKQETPKTAPLPKTETPKLPEAPKRPAPSPVAFPISRDRAFEFNNDAALDARMMKEISEAKKSESSQTKEFVFDPKNYIIPETAKLPSDGMAYVPKTAGYPPIQVKLEPGYVVTRKLLFEELNSERYGWDLGFIQPVVSTAFFYKDTLLWPAHLASNLRERYDTSAGKCLPGSPVPYFLYPEEISLFGATVGAATFVGTGFMFP
ncbi:MAG: hypothetical protein ACRC8S_22130 [Fimbriiglobus sp.]